VKPQIYKVASTWIFWIPGVRVYRFPNWESAVRCALDGGAQHPDLLAPRLTPGAIGEVPGVGYHPV
jgi:hypothetical protein